MLDKVSWGADKNWNFICLGTSHPNVENKEVCSESAQWAPTKEWADEGYWYCAKHIRLHVNFQGELTEWLKVPAC